MYDAPTVAEPNVTPLPDVLLVVLIGGSPVR